jgi:hypothetical protein
MRPEYLILHFLLLFFFPLSLFSLLSPLTLFPLFLSSFFLLSPTAAVSTVGQILLRGAVEMRDEDD